MKQIIKMEHCGVYYIELSDGTLGFFASASELTKYFGMKYPTAQPGSWVLKIEQRAPRYFKNYQHGRAFIRKFYNM